MRRLPKSFYSWTTIIGALLASVSFLLIAFSIIISLLFPQGVGDYIGIFSYIILPIFLIIGLLMMPFGTLSKMKKDKKREVVREVKFPIVNLNDPGQRLVVLIFVLGTAVFLLFTSVGSYQVFHYTESNEFCGTLCHTVMEPEYVTYHGSAHSKVKCVECHVGSGATWYVKSKMSGLYQVYSVLFNKYPTPIETPVHSLRPARETCEECHWPEKFYHQKIINHKSYLADEENTQWNVQLVMKTASDHPAKGLAEGIHWHINPDVKIEYTSTLKRDTIAEVKYTNIKTGEVRVFKDENIDTSDMSMPREVRTMDCMDCHNRPSHDYLSPQNFIDFAITAGDIPKDIPEIKSMAMMVLYKDFPTVDSAYKYFDYKLNKYYNKYYDEFMAENPGKLEKAIAGIKDGYSKNFFPLMKSKWSEYPNHLGHSESPGCFRCHNNSFASEDGHVISHECDLCHSIKAQGPEGDIHYANGDSTLMFVHPQEMEDWKEMACYECHQELY